MTVIICPAPDDRVEHLYQELLFHRSVPANHRPDFLQESVHVFLGRFYQKFAVILSDVHSEEVEPLLNVRDAGFLWRELQAPVAQKLLDQWLDFIFQQFLGRAGNDEVIRSNLRHAREEVEKWTERLANLREDLKLRQDTSGDNFRIKLDGQVLDNRGVAGELLLRRAGKIKFRLGEDIRLGTFAGFDLFIRAGFNNTAELVLRGRNSYSTRVTDTALGTIRSLEATAQGFEERATRLESDIKDSQKRAVELEAKVGSPFEKEERYHHLVKRQSEIEEKLDLTKNQAPAQAESAADDEVTEENSQHQTQVKTAGQNRRAAIRV